ncbi:hypothetical protein LTR65_009470 [Meristemomyces frigidus]
MSGQGSAQQAEHGSQDEADGPALGKGKRRASPPSHGHPDAPPARRHAPMGAEIPIVRHDKTTVAPGQSQHDLDPNQPLQITDASSHPPAPGPAANPFAASPSDLRLSDDNFDHSSHRTANQQSTSSRHARDEYERYEHDDAATTSTERQEREEYEERKEYEEREEARYQLGRRLNLQRAQGHISTIAAVLQMYHNSARDEEVEEVRAKLESIVDGMTQ